MYMETWYIPKYYAIASFYLSLPPDPYISAFALKFV